MSDGIKLLISGVITIGLITAVGLHATGLASFTQSAGNATSGILGTAEKG